MIPNNRPLLDGNEKKYLSECIETGWISSEGPFVKSFESAFASYVGRKHGIAVCNGSVALDLAVAALGIGQGDEVIIPSFTIISCAASVVRAGATPVVVDCRRDTWNIASDLIEQKITPRTKAILAVHIYGLPADMDPIIAVAKKYGLHVIEDAAEQFGQTYRGKNIGSFGDITAVSFYPNKHVTTGEGGMVLTDSDALADRARSMRNLCFDKERRFIHEDLGWNFRMSNLQAAVGVAQLERIDEFVKRKRIIGAIYNEILKDCSSIQLPLLRTEYSENIYWVYGVVLREHVDFDAREAISRMKSLGVECRHFFWPMHMQPALRARGLYEGERCPNSEFIARRGFYLPSGLGLTDEEISESGAALKRMLA